MGDPVSEFDALVEENRVEFDALDVGERREAIVSAASYVWQSEQSYRAVEPDMKDWVAEQDFNAALVAWEAMPDEQKGMHREAWDADEGHLPPSYEVLAQYAADRTASNAEREEETRFDEHVAATLETMCLDMEG